RQGWLADGTMGLGNFLVYLLADGCIFLKPAPGKPALLGWYVSQKRLYLLQHFRETDISYHREDDLRGIQAVSDEVKKVLLGKAGNRLLRAKDVPSQGVILEDRRIKLVLEGVIRGIPIHGHFFQDNLPFPLDLFGRKNAVESNVTEQFSRLAKMGMQHTGIKTDLFLGGIGVQFASYRIQSVKDMKGSTLGSPLKRHMFPKMRQPLLLLRLIPTADV